MKCICPAAHTYYHSFTLECVSTVVIGNRTIADKLVVWVNVCGVDLQAARLFNRDGESLAEIRNPGCRNCKGSGIYERN
jgi:hypothetical protein